MKSEKNLRKLLYLLTLPSHCWHWKPKLSLENWSQSYSEICSPWSQKHHYPWTSPGWASCSWDSPIPGLNASFWQRMQDCPQMILCIMWTLLSSAAARRLQIYGVWHDGHQPEKWCVHLCIHAFMFVCISVHKHDARISMCMCATFHSHFMGKYTLFLCLTRATKDRNGRLSYCW